MSEQNTLQDEVMDSKSNVNEITMMVEREEVHHPDINELIRSLDTPPPS